jgi:hypothetical protein
MALGLGCSSEGRGLQGEVADAGNPAPSAQLAAPKFTYHSAPPGRGTGIRALVTVNGKELTSNEVEVTLSAASEGADKFLSTPDPAGQSRAGSGAVPALKPAAPAPKAAPYGLLGAPLETCPAVGDEPLALGTVNGSVCYISASGSVGSLGVQYAGTYTLFFTSEGLYSARSMSKLAYIPPDFLNQAHTWSVGCIAGDEPGRLTTEHLDDLLSLSLSYSIAIYSQGVTFFSHVESGPVRAFQVDTGLSVSVPAFGLALPLRLGIAIQAPAVDEELPSAGPYFVRPWGSGCDYAGFDGNLWEYAKAANASRGDAFALTAEDALGEVIASGLTPLFDTLGTPGAGGVGHHVPAGSNADMFAEMLSRNGTALEPGAVNTSVDGLLVSMRDEFVAAGDDPSAIIAAGNLVQRRSAVTVPSRLELTAVLDKAKAAMYAADEIATLARRSGSERFVTDDVIEIAVPVGEEAEFTLTAEEVATLVGRPVADVIHARVLANAGLDIVDVEFALPEEGLTLTLTPKDGDMIVRLDVDLSTAAGDFPDDVGSWVVRPALRLIRVRPGEPTHAVLVAPGDVPSGAPVSLNVQVVDDAGKIVDLAGDVEFVDARGNVLGSSKLANGTALLQFVPEPTVPQIESALPADLTVGGEPVTGFEILGNGFSRDAELLLDGAPLIVEDEYEVKGSQRILCVPSVPLGAGEHRFQVVNPEGFSSEEVALGD